MKIIIFFIFFVLIGISSSITFYILYSHNQSLNYFGNNSQQDNLWLLPHNKNVADFYESYSITGKITSIQNDDSIDGSNLTIDVTLPEVNGNSYDTVLVPEKPDCEINLINKDNFKSEVNQENFVGALKPDLTIQVVMIKKSSESNFHPQIIEIYENN